MIPMTPEETARLLEQTEHTVRVQKAALDAAIPLLAFEAKLKALAEDARCSSELIGIAVRNHFSASGGVAPPADASFPSDPGSVRSVPGAEAENKLAPPELGPPTPGDHEDQLRREGAYGKNITPAVDVWKDES